MKKILKFAAIFCTLPKWLQKLGVNISEKIIKPPQNFTFNHKNCNLFFILAMEVMYKSFCAIATQSALYQIEKIRSWAPN